MGTAHLHSLQFLVDVDLSTLTAGLVAHIPDYATVLSGLHAAGMLWMVACQIAVPDYRFVEATDTRAAVRRSGQAKSLEV